MSCSGEENRDLSHNKKCQAPKTGAWLVFYFSFTAVP